ncbi:RadC family protein [Vibrio agarivorans]|uniref:RadC family protein n=1 Tax=Vibrio agarivorans TaxID=153622 RepID=UPI0025B32A0D|nr:DNA repair protein RadC [Vibrio agarivorans]MDN3660452.1 DNA repair protein RadC [Vibrio agarivorans]
MHSSPCFNYHQSTPTELHEILETAASMLAAKYARQGSFANPEASKQFLQMKLAHYDKEVFAVMLLDNQNRLIRFEELFTGTIDAASIYPREVVKLALDANAAAVIFGHNHPSGVPEPSLSDRRITSRLCDALALIDVRVLDHIVVGEQCVSFAERGWL